MNFPRLDVVGYAGADNELSLNASLSLISSSMEMSFPGGGNSSTAGQVDPSHFHGTQTFITLICGNKLPTKCNRGFYCRSYCLLNMFRAPLCPSSGAQEYYTVVAACGMSCCKIINFTARNTTGSNHCIILLSS